MVLGGVIIQLESASTLCKRALFVFEKTGSYKKE